MRRDFIHLAGLPVRFLSGRNKWTPVPEAIAMEKYHHYCRGRVATQFCSFSMKKGKPPEWFAQHIPDHFNTFAKLLDAIRDSSNEVADCWFDSGDARYENLNVQFIYPIVVVSGSPLFEVIQYHSRVDVRERTRFLYRASGVSNQHVVEYAVDVVVEAAFPTLMSMIGREMKATAQQLRQRSKTVRKSRRRVYNTAKRTRSAEEMRRLVQFPFPEAIRLTKE